MIQNRVTFNSSADDLNAHPIDPSWILEGTPTARIKLMSGSSDGMANTYIWDCTAGTFDWHYYFDETACVLEGSVIVDDENGVSHTLNPGDTMFFPLGSTAHWNVPHYVRKVAIMRYPMSPVMVLISRIVNKLGRLVGRGGSPGGAGPGL